jgi:hypothetical protein
MGLSPVNKSARPNPSTVVSAPGAPAAGPEAGRASSAPAAARDSTAFTQADPASARPSAGSNLSMPVPDSLRRSSAPSSAAAVDQAQTVSPSTELNVTDPTQREKLIGHSSQVNALSEAAGNGQSICAGAALTNAMLMDCKTPEDCKRNAQALMKMADKSGAWNHLPPGVKVEDVQKALDNLEKGKLSPSDAQNLQQLMYTVARRVQGGDNPLINSGGMAATVAMLHQEGAFKNSSPAFHESSLPGGGNHWTATVDGKHANSMPAKVSEFTPSGMALDGKNPTWRAEVRLDNGPPARVHAAWRQSEKQGKLRPTGEGKAYFVSFDPGKFDLKKSRQLFENAEVARVDRAHPGVVKDAKDEFAKRVKEGGAEAGAKYLRSLSPASLLKDVIRDLAEGRSPALNKCLKELPDDQFHRLNKLMQERLEMAGDKYTLERWRDALERARPTT